MTGPALDNAQTTAESNPERHKQAEALSRDILSEFKPGDSAFKPGDHSQINDELKGLGFPDVQVGNGDHLQVQGKDVLNTKYENGNLAYDRPDSNGGLQHVTLNMSDHPGLETVQNDKGQIVQTSEVDAQGKQHTYDFSYDENGKLNSAKVNGREVLPSDAKDAKVEPSNGELSYTRSDGVRTAIAIDGVQTLTSPPDAQGRSSSVSIDGNKVTVTSSTNGKVEQSFEHTDVNPNSVKVDADGSVHMDLAVWSTVPGTEGDNSSYSRFGTETIGPDGKETQIINSEKGAVTVEREHSGGKVTKLEEDGISLLDDKGNPLPGLSTDPSSLAVRPPKPENDPQTGKLKSYWTSSGVQKELDENGKTKAYHTEDGFNFEHHNDAWYFHRDGGAYVKINEPKLKDDGTVEAREADGINVGRTHTLNGTAVEGSTLLGGIAKGFARNLGHELVDGNLKPLLWGAGLAQRGLQNAGIVGESEKPVDQQMRNIIDPIDENKSSLAENLAGQLGTKLGDAVPLGKIGRVIEGIQHAHQKVEEVKAIPHKVEKLEEMGEKAWHALFG